MKIYLVGGATRDILLGVTPKDYDFVVVGATEEDFRDHQRVGKDFPVFLEPIHGWELALARTECKVGTGYKGFTTVCNGVTLEEDLFRRDLTLNSIAIEVDFETSVLLGEPVTIGTWIDPFNGREDILNKVLRPTSEAFKEDSVRVLRLARLLARFGEDWTISEEATNIMDSMYYSGMLYDLKPERVFLELQKALSEKTPSLFFTTLYRYSIFDEIDMLYGVPQKVEHHPEVEDKLEVL